MKNKVLIGSTSVKTGCLLIFIPFLIGYTTPFNGYTHQPNNSLYFAPKIEEEWKTAYYGLAPDLTSINSNAKTSVNNQLTAMKSSCEKVCVSSFE